MPFVHIELLEGRTPEQKEEMAKEIVDAMECLDFAPRESIRVIYEEMAPEDYYSGENIEK